MTFNERLSTTLSAHRQTKRNSCVPCSVEFILKLHGHLEADNHSLQASWDGKPFGYEEAKAELSEKKISLERAELDLSALRERAEIEFSNETPLMFSWPTHMGFDPNIDDTIRIIDLHMHIAVRDSRGMHFVGFGEHGHTEAPCDREVIWSRIRTHSPAYLVETFIHRP